MTTSKKKGAASGRKKALPAKTSNSKKAKGSTAKRPKGASSGQNTADVMLSYLYGMKQMGQEIVSEKDLLIKTNYSGTDSKGYRDAMKRLRDDGHVEKTKGNVSLTDGGMSYVEENRIAEGIVEAVTMADHQARLKVHIVQNAKAPEAKVVAVWNVLLDGKLHDANELLKVTGYSGTDSKGYRDIMMWLNKLDLLEKDGKKFRFTDKMYHLGNRPN